MSIKQLASNCTLLPISKCTLYGNSKLKRITIRKSIITNKNIKRIFLSVNFREILLMKIFSRYIPRELQWKKILKQSKKNDDVLFLPTELPMEFILSVKFVAKSVGKL